jgi:NAD(P)H-hydrate epimerase
LGAEAAGVDLVYIASVEDVVKAATTLRPTLIPVRLEGENLHTEHVDTIKPVLERVDAIALGMGLGTREETKEAIEIILQLAREAKKPVVIDADGIKLLSRIGLDALQGIEAVLTPHDAEFARLFGERPAPVTCIPRRIEDAADAATRAYGATILLKGPVDVIAEPTRARLNKTGAPSMSAGGTGDVLAGLVAALLAKGVPRFHAASVAAYLNGAAGAAAYREKGDAATTTDLLGKIPEMLTSPETYAKDAVIYRRVDLRRDC